VDPYATASELAGRIRRRELSPVEVLDACIARIEARDPSLNAFVHRGFDEARERARAAERAVSAGEDLGLLHGVPTAIKDLFNFKPGWPATYGGVRALKEYTVEFDSPFPERMERAGAIVVGMTNSPVLGFRGTCDNGLFGPTRNPFDPARNSGGSSGGSAAAVADGLLSIAQGTDGGGSIRIPAAWCGVYGFKPSFGRVPYVARPNAFAGVNPFLFTGPITRTVEDAALGLTVLQGYDSRDPLSLDEDVDFRSAPGRSIEGWRIAYSPDFGTFPVDSRVRAVVAEAARAFEEAGARVEEVEIDLGRDQRELSDAWCRLIIPINLEVFEDFKAQGLDLLADHRDDFPPQYLRWVEEGYRLSALDVQRQQQIRTEVYEAIRLVMDDYHLLLTPTLACLPVENADDGNTVGPSEIEGVEVDPLIGWCLTYPINFSGHPAASIPAGLVDGLPVGMQIVGRRYGDADVLAASGAFERLRPWRDSYRACERPPGGPPSARPDHQRLRRR
jgi:amidase/aspartyl-tRNA(Asn)/glutamyl-tRNA(Gln) amidotransferase subunit A